MTNRIFDMFRRHGRHRWRFQHEWTFVRNYTTWGTVGHAKRQRKCSSPRQTIRLGDVTRQMCYSFRQHLLCTYPQIFLCINQTKTKQNETTVHKQATYWIHWEQLHLIILWSPLSIYNLHIYMYKHHFYSLLHRKCPAAHYKSLTCVHASDQMVF